jgi:hypothetical protein
MLTCDCSVARLGSAVLVEAVVASDASVPVRARLSARTDGPVWPPRQNGVPERPWADGELSLVVPPDGRTAVGFATPADPGAPPVEVVEAAPAPEPDDDGPVPDPTPNGVVRALGDGRPPRDAVPLPDVSGDGSDGAPDESAPPASDDADRSVDPDGDLPRTVAAWFDAIERQVAAAEQRTAGADGAADAGPGPQDATGDATGAAAADLDESAASLRRVATRAADLADRCARLDAAGDGP